MVSFNKNTVNTARSGARMIVIVPELLENVADFSRDVYTQAVSQKREVLYLGLNNLENDGLASARQLATLTALTQGGPVRACALQILAENWTDALCQVAHPGDMILWQEGGTLIPGNMERALSAKFPGGPGDSKPSILQASHRFHAMFLWLTGLVLLVGFTYLEVLLGGRVGGAWKKIVLMAIFTVEAGSFYLWDRVFS